MANQLKEELVLSTSKFDSNINSVIKKVEELKNKGSKVGSGFDSSMSKMIEKATGFNGSLGSLIGVLGKFGGALGVAMSTGELFNRMMNQSQTLGDAVTKVQNQASEAVNYFASSLASADFGSFLDGLRNIISLAGDAADAMDRAASIGLRFGWTNQSKLGSYNRAMAEARNPENSKEDRLKYLNEAKEISKQITKAENIKSKADINAAFKTIRTELSKVKYNGKHVDANKLTDKEIRDLFDVANFEKYEAIHERMKAAKDTREQVTNYKYYKANQSHIAQADMDKFSKDIRMLAAYAANEINDDADSPLGKAVQMIGAVDAMLANQAEREAQTGKLAQKIGSSTKKITSNTKTSSNTNNTNYANGSVGYYEKLISDLQKQIKLQVDSTEIEKLKNQIKEAQTQLDLLLNPQTLNLTKLEGLTSFSTIKLDLEIPTEPIVKVYDEANKKIRSILLSNDVGEIGEEQAKELIDVINKELENQGLKPIKVELNTDIYKQAQERINKVLDAYDMGSIGHNQAQQLIDEVNRTLKANKLKPIEVEVRTDTQKMFDNLQYNANSIVDGFEGIDTVISNINSLSEAIENGANAWEIFMNVLQTGVNIIQAVSSVLEMLNTLTKLYGATSEAASQTVAAGTKAEAQASIENASAKATESVASATASGAKLPFPYNLAAIAAGIAAVVSALALMGTFANGGVIGGNSYSGDRLLARVNSGEAILNQNQQKHLFTLLDGNHGTSISGGNVRFVIQGKDLVGTLKNYNNRNSKLI